MGFYDAFKDAINLAQKADNIELYRKLLDLNAQALNLQEENMRLRQENAELKKQKDIEAQIVRHKYPYITLSNDSIGLKYCATCWDAQRKLIQMKEYKPYDSFELICNVCKSKCKI